MKIAGPNDWEHKPLPAMYTRIELNLRYTSAEMLKIAHGVIPQAMEEKWFIYYQNDILYFHRSWTGYCVYEVHFCKGTTDHSAVYALVNRDPEQYTETDDAYDGSLVKYLINVLLLHQATEFPLKDGELAVNPLAAWGQVGQPSVDSFSGDGEQTSTELSRDLIRIIPMHRFLGLPTVVGRPYAFYADFDSVKGLTVADAYRLVKGMTLPPMECHVKERRTPFAWGATEGELDAPLAKIKVSDQNQVSASESPQSWLARERFVVIRVPSAIAQRELDVFPATWRAIAFILSDPTRMGVAENPSCLPGPETLAACIHAKFRDIQLGAGGFLLAERQTKEGLGLCNFNGLPSEEEEASYYQYISADSAFTNRIVDIFGLAHRCWHGCGCLGWRESPLCRFYFLKNVMSSKMEIMLLRGRDILS